MPGREERKQRITEQRREQILEAAFSVFSEVGYDRASVPEIARRAGIAVGTIYNYFPGKRDILTALMEHHIIEPVLSFIGSGALKRDESVLGQILENRLTFSLHNSDRFIPIFMEIHKDAEMLQQYRENLLKPVLRQAEQFVASIMQTGGFRENDPAIITRVITALLVGLAVLSRTEGADSPLRGMSAKKLAADIATILLDGLRR